VRKILQVAISIETLVNINTITIEVVTSSCALWSSVASRWPSSTIRGVCSLEWMAQLKLCKAVGKVGSSGSSRSGCRQAASHGIVGKKGGNQEERSSLSCATRNGKCLNCGKKGHWAKDCRSKPMRAEAHLNQAKEEGKPMLMMAWVTVVSCAVPNHSPPRCSDCTAPNHVAAASTYSHP
jgi:hypothetical protein